jgi:hypothetical protein
VVDDSCLRTLLNDHKLQLINQNVRYGILCYIGGEMVSYPYLFTVNRDLDPTFLGFVCLPLLFENEDKVLFLFFFSSPCM